MTTPLGAELDRLRAENERLREALTKLANEAGGCVEMARPAIGNTNANCLRYRVELAREALKCAPCPTS